MSRRPRIAIALSFFLSLLIYGLIAWWCYQAPLLTYDEAAYSATAQRLAVEGGWSRLYGSGDLFFFPPLFNYLAGALVALGIERLAAVRFIAVIAGAGVNALVVALCLRHLTARAALFAFIIALFMPVKAFYSVVGQVELPMLFLVLAALYVALSDGKGWRTPVLAAFFLAAAVWTKETALGFFPLFGWLFFRDRRALFLFSGLFALFITPLVVQTFFPSSYDLFYELTNPFIAVLGLDPDAALMNLLKQFGIMPSALGGFGTLFSAAFALLVVFSFARLSRAELFGNRLLLFAAGSLVLWGAFFLYFPKKFDYYLIPTALFLLFFITRSLDTRPRLGIAATALLVGLSLSTIPAYRALRDDVTALDTLLTQAMTEKPGARIAMTMPRTGEYLVEREELPLTVVELGLFSCHEMARGCFKGSDYFIGYDDFLKLLFCDSWPLRDDRCDTATFLRVVRSIEPIGEARRLRLYRLGPAADEFR